VNGILIDTLPTRGPGSFSRFIMLEAYCPWLAKNVMESKQETKCPGTDHRYTYLASLHFFNLFIYKAFGSRQMLAV